MAQRVRTGLAMQETQETWLPSRGAKILEEEMATHPSIFLPGKFMDRGAQATVQRDCKESDTTFERLSTDNNTPFSPLKFEDKGTFAYYFP